MRDAVVASVAGGIAASLAMDVVQDACATWLERGRAADVFDEEVEAITSVVRILGTYAPFIVSERRARATGRVVHYTLGVAFAGAYVAGVPRVRWLAAAGGVAFGAGLFVLSDRILIPMLKLGRAWNRYSRAERFNAFASHVAYGVVLETLRARLVERGGRA